MIHEENGYIFSGMQLWTGQAWVTDHVLIVEKEKIHAILPIRRDDLPKQMKHHLKHHHFPADYKLVPGFIDLHIHGALGKDIMDDEIAAFETIALALAAEGVTGFLATTLSAPVEKITSVLAKVPAAQQLADGAALLGVHLEGPFISPEKGGAHLQSYVLPPNMEMIQAWQKVSANAIKVVTIAPELPGALAMITALKQQGIIVSLGHTNATYAEMQAGINAGGSQATHLFNAMRGIHQREPGAVSALLLSEQVMTELIVDGIHLHPAIVSLSYKLKQKEHILLVTDAIRAKCLGNGKYYLGEQTVNVHEGKAQLVEGTLAGSVLRMPHAIQNMMHFTGCSLIDAIEMATLNPARALGLAHRKGSLTVGKDADLVVVDATFNVKLTMRSGRVIFQS